MSVLPVVAYGDPVLKKKGESIDPDYPGLEGLIEDMWETMYKAQGVGLSAPQVGKSIRLFLIDASPFSEDEPALEGFKKVFINAKIIEQSGKPWFFNEGCLSFPELREDVQRRPNIRIRYQDEHFNEFEEEYSGLAARIIQHEYDHTKGVLMVDHFSQLKKTLLKKKLSNISKGLVSVNYPMRFSAKKR